MAYLILDIETIPRPPLDEEVEEVISKKVQAHIDRTGDDPENAESLIRSTSPFFGKPTLVFRAEAEWIETETRGYSRLFKGNKEDIKYLANVLHQEKKFYLNKSQLPSEIIYNKSSSYCLRD